MSESRSLSRNLRRQVFDRDRWRCYYCDKELTFDKAFGDVPTVDHLTPLSRDGSDNLDNLVCACKRCNSRKHQKTLEEYRAWVTEADCWFRQMQLRLFEVLAFPPTPFEDMLVELADWLQTNKRKTTIFPGEEK